MYAAVPYAPYCDVRLGTSCRGGCKNKSTGNTGCVPHAEQILLVEYCAAGWHTNMIAGCICAHRL